MSNVGRKSVTVTFAGNEDVIQHILSVKEKSSLGTPSKTKRVKNKEKADNIPLYDETKDQYEYTQIKALNENLQSVAGEDVYAFSSPRRTGSMAAKAQQTKEMETTPLKSKCGTPRRRLATKCPPRKTPRRLNRRNPAAVSDDESSTSFSESSDEDENNNTEKQDSVEQYFLEQDSKINTSEKTLAHLETSRMDPKTLRAELSKITDPFSSERASLLKKHRHNYRKWMLYMCNNFNILVHGLGSKYDLIDDFRKQYLINYDCVVVNGYFPSLTIRSILSAIIEDVLCLSVSSANPFDQLQTIQKEFEPQGCRDMFLVIHNIDGVMLRAKKPQLILSHLARIAGVHIIASIDHVNAPLIWDGERLSRFNWLWFDGTTYSRYSAETGYENSLLVQQTGGLALSSLMHVTASLTPNARGIFMVIVHHQMDNKDNQTYPGLSFTDLYHRCRESFLVNSNLTLRTQLTEFKDHKLIKLKNVDGVEYLLIPLDYATLQEFTTSQEN